MKKEFTRRDFLKALTAGGAAGALGVVMKPGSAAAAGTGFRVLVKAELLGGSDSHAIWLPTDSAKFGALQTRRVNAMFASEVSQILDIGYSQGIGLHPNLSSWIPHIPHIKFFMNTSNALSYGQSGSHEDAQNIMTMGTKDFNGKFEGWTARIFDQDPNCHLMGFLGSRGANQNCDPLVPRCANTPPTTVQTFETFKLDGTSMHAAMGGANNSKYIADVIRRLAESRSAAQQPSHPERLADAALRGMFPAIEEVSTTLTFQSPMYASYPTDTSFALQIRNIAMKIQQLLVEGSEERFIFNVGIGGFDVHEAWTYTTPLLINQLAVLGIFMSDLQAMGVFDKVVIMTSTEFGRTLYSNGVGTDHGESSTTMVMGGTVNGGSNSVFGDVLTADQFGTLLVSPSHVDNRGIISAILNDFMGIQHTFAFPGPISQEFSIGNYDLWK